MKFCGKCGEPINEKLAFCGKCGEPIDKNKIGENQSIPILNNLNKDDSLYSFNKIDESMVNETINTSLKEKKPISKKKKVALIVISILVITILLLAMIFYKPIMAKIYEIKGDKNYIENKKIEYYCKSMEFNYDSNIIEKVSEVLNGLDNGEEILKDYEPLLSKKDFNNLMSNIYVNKAVKSFQNEDYEKTMEIIKDAENYGYNKSDFFYYDETKTKLDEIEAKKIAELDKKKAEEEKKKSEELDKERKANSSKNTPSVSYNIITTNGYIIPDSDIRYLNKSDLAGMSKATLALARNEIWARYGYIFKEEPFKSYFPRQSWYYPNAYVNASIEQLTDIEQYNVKLIKSIEDSM
ncbi:YARHG domain-containing protein [Clostridium tarantellae]|uniref:YARHG domain-containing protein n=1 Tax=Clostridium tarantellae TaxID=39493 RepID=A0A6I1MR96_9CLOT|nr:YARHG domain-containing protein [Clostridium tarantellae]MPQ44697.1 YARHG domain-containing protein [Clostridium tarantellae]